MNKKSKLRFPFATHPPSSCLRKPTAPLRDAPLLLHLPILYLSYAGDNADGEGGEEPALVGRALVPPPPFLGTIFRERPFESFTW